MKRKNIYFMQLCGLCFFILSVIGHGFPEEAAGAPLLSAETSLIVIDAGFANVNSPSQVVDYDVTHYIRNVNYVPNLVSWSWGPLPGFNAWPPGSTPLTARIWAWRTYDGGRTYIGNAWDYILNTTTSKHKSSNVPSWIGTMTSSLCHTNSTCNATERTNIAFFPPFDKSSVGNGFVSFDITPKDVGVFYQNGTQQFKALAVTDAGVVLDLTEQVDWYIDPEGAPYMTPGMDTTEGAIATIDAKTGLATVTNTWGRVMVHACYPKGCGPNSGGSSTAGANHLLLSPRPR